MSKYIHIVLTYHEGSFTEDEISQLIKALDEIVYKTVRYIRPAICVTDYETIITAQKCGIGDQNLDVPIRCAGGWSFSSEDLTEFTEQASCRISLHFDDHDGLETGKTSVSATGINGSVHVQF